MKVKAADESALDDQDDSGLAEPSPPSPRSPTLSFACSTPHGASRRLRPTHFRIYQKNVNASRASGPASEEVWG